MPKEQVLNCIS